MKNTEQDRSEIIRHIVRYTHVETLVCAARYIHQNPIKAGMVKEIGKYRWSSYKAYLNDKVSIIDTDFILARLGEKAEYVKFMNQEEDKNFLEYENIVSISDEKLIILIDRLYKKHKIQNILTLEKRALNDILLMIRAIPGTSIRQISRVTGVPISIVRYIKQHITPSPCVKNVLGIIKN